MHTRHWNSGQHACRLHPTLLLNVLYPKRYKLSLTKMWVETYRFFFFSKLEKEPKTFPKIEGKLTEAWSSLSHTTQEFMKSGNLLDTQIPTTCFCTQSFPRGKVQSGRRDYSWSQSFLFQPTSIFLIFPFLSLKNILLTSKLIHKTFKLSTTAQHHYVHSMPYWKDTEVIYFSNIPFRYVL